jgi:hypothetical protein
MFHIHQHQYQYQQQDQQEPPRIRQARSRSVSHQVDYSIDTFSALPVIGNEDNYVLHKGAASGNPVMESHHSLNPYQQGVSIERPHSAGASLYSPVTTLDASALDVLNDSSSALLYEERKNMIFEPRKNCDHGWGGPSLEPGNNISQTSNAAKRDETKGELAHEADSKICFAEGMMPGNQGRVLISNDINLDGINQKYPPQLQDSPAMCPASAVSVTSRYAGSACRSEGLCDLIAPLPNQR